jgi:hypothetical protein
MSESLQCQPQLASLVRPIAENLGLKPLFADIDVTFPAKAYSSITAIYSPHKQSVSYQLVDHILHRERLFTKPSELAQDLQKRAQVEVNRRLLDLPTGAIYNFRFNTMGEFIEQQGGVTEESLWTLDTTVISALENAVRGLYDLPLGDSAAILENWRALTFKVDPKLDMQRPYLHLFAHNPRYKIYKFTSHSGFMSVSGKGNLTDSIIHGVDYLEGEINE